MSRARHFRDEQIGNAEPGAASVTGALEVASATVPGLNADG